MKKTLPFVITISRQLGSGGAYIGQQLAKNLNIYYADREIISQAAKELSVLEEEIELRDEKMTSFWQSLLEQYNVDFPDTYMAPQIYVPTDHELFEVESEIIKRIVKERSAVIIGRCGSYILREHPNHVNIFLYGDIDSRKVRIQKLYNVSEDTAEKMITKSDAERRNHYHKHTGKDWTDIRQYDISIDTSKIGFDKSAELISKYLELIK